MFYLAGKLGSNDITSGEEQEIQAILRQTLCLEQGVPVAVGSGRSALPYKLRATAHSIKLTSASWERVAQQMRYTATWVGDLGEKGIGSVKANLQDIMGSWICHGDDADVGAAEEHFGKLGEDFGMDSG